MREVRQCHRATQVRVLVEDPHYARRAAEIGGLVRTEDGVKRACEVLEASLAPPRVISRLNPCPALPCPTPVRPDPLDYFHVGAPASPRLQSEGGRCRGGQPVARGAFIDCKIRQSAVPGYPGRARRAAECRSPAPQLPPASTRRGVWPGVLRAHPGPQGFLRRVRSAG
jgi:hypothetical protein